jgi:hypothetical protein
VTTVEANWTDSPHLHSDGSGRCILCGNGAADGRWELCQGCRREQQSRTAATLPETVGRVCMVCRDGKPLTPLPYCQRCSNRFDKRSSRLR